MRGEGGGKGKKVSTYQRGRGRIRANQFPFYKKISNREGQKGHLVKPGETSGKKLKISHTGGNGCDLKGREIRDLPQRWPVTGEKNRLPGGERKKKKGL